MRFIKLLGGLVVFYSLSYFYYGVLQLNALIRLERSDPWATFIIGVNFFIGILAFSLGLGLLFTREWARLLWLAAVSVLFLTHVSFLLLFYVISFTLTLQIMNLILISLMLLISWSKLTQPEVKAHFR